MVLNGNLCYYIGEAELFTEDTSFHYQSLHLAATATIRFMFHTRTFLRCTFM